MLILKSLFGCYIQAAAATAAAKPTAAFCRTAAAASSHFINGWQGFKFKFWRQAIHFHLIFYANTSQPINNLPTIKLISSSHKYTCPCNSNRNKVILQITVHASYIKQIRLSMHHGTYPKSCIPVNPSSPPCSTWPYKISWPPAYTIYCSQNSQVMTYVNLYTAGVQTDHTCALLQPNSSSDPISNTCHIRTSTC